MQHHLGAISKMTDLLTTAEAARRLGLAPGTVRNWISERRIAHVKVGRRSVRISTTEIARLIRIGTVPALFDHKRAAANDRSDDLPGENGG